jgi:hypothetical protein
MELVHPVELSELEEGSVGYVQAPKVPRPQPTAARDFHMPQKTPRDTNHPPP